MMSNDSKDILCTIEKIFHDLSKENRVYFSEADLQLAFGVKLMNEFNSSEDKVILEYKTSYPSSIEGKNRRIYIDIVIISGEKYYPIELKYRTKKYVFEFDNEKYELSSQGARDNGCYGYLRDVCRINEFKDKIGKKFGGGITIFLTNDDNYKNKMDDSKEGKWIQQINREKNEGDFWSGDVDGNKNKRLESSKKFYYSKPKWIPFDNKFMYIFNKIKPDMD